MTWDGVRSTLQWCVVLLLVGVIAAGGLAAHCWSAKDALITETVHAHLAKALPECTVEFEAVRLVDANHVEITHLDLRAAQTNAPLLRIPRIVVEFDAGMLRDYRRVVIRDLMAQSPEMYVIRGYDNRWNWGGITIRQPPAGITPTWNIKNGTLIVGCQSAIGGPIKAISCQGVQAQLNPKSHRRYQLDGRGVADAIGPVQLAGLIDLNSGEWNVQGSAVEVRLGDPMLLEMAGKMVPSLNEQLARLHASNQAFLAQAKPQYPIRTASADPNASLGIESSEASMMHADLSLQFELGQPQKDAPLTYFVRGSIQNGYLSEMLLRIPLYELQGEFLITPDRVQVTDLKAANGPSTLYVNGEAQRQNEEWSKNFSVRIAQLQLDERIRDFLPDVVRKPYDLVRPSGTFDLDVDLDQQADRPIRLTLRKFTAVNCKALCEYFQYPVDNISGHIVQRGTAFDVDMQGEASGKPVTLTGVIDPANPEETLRLHAVVTDLPVDQLFRNALQRPEQAAIRKTFEILHLEGVAERLEAEIIRGTRTKGRPLVRLDAQVRDASLNYVNFPYSLNGLSGHVSFDPLAQNFWLFEDLRAHHDDAQVTGRGAFDLSSDQHTLTLELAGVQVPLNHELRKASVTACPQLETVWADFDIAGMMDVDRIGLVWRPGTRPDVVLQGIRWSNGRLTPAAFPYSWTNVTAALNWEGSRLKIHSFLGDHAGTYLQIDGSGNEGAAYIQIPTDSRVDPRLAWQVHLRNLSAVRLNPNDEFRRALPRSLADALYAVDLQGPVDIRMGLDMKGWNDLGGNPHNQLITASWYGTAALNDNMLSAGIPLSNVSGAVRVLSGKWDGANLAMEGYAKLDTVRALDIPFRNIHGPFLIKDERFTFGSPKFTANAVNYSNDNPEKQSSVRAEAYGGDLGLDVDLSLQGDARTRPYQLELAASDVELAQWAIDRGMDSRRLKGKVNGKVQISGVGNDAMNSSGEGWVQIMPAALYELPVFAQMFARISFRPTGDVAFNYAYGDFTIHEGLFDFSKIELVGDALSLRGRGTVGYAGSRASMLKLDFYTMMTNHIPVIEPFVRALGNRWIRVQVLGTVNEPLATVEPRIGPLDQMFSEFMKGVESGQHPRTPPRPTRP